MEEVVKKKRLTSKPQENLCASSQLYRSAEAGVTRGRLGGPYKVKVWARYDRRFRAHD
jgi:hypothetical protein